MGTISQSGCVVGAERLRAVQKKNCYGDALSVGRKTMTTEKIFSACT